MQSIVNYIGSVATGVSNLFDIIITFVKDLVNIVKVVAKVPVFIVSFFSWMPEGLVFGIGLLLSVVAVYKIMGRD